MSWLLIAFALGLVAGGLTTAWIMALSVVLRSTRKADR